jgi:hypothetical protein
LTGPFTELGILTTMGQIQGEGGFAARCKEERMKYALPAAILVVIVFLIAAPPPIQAQADSIGLGIAVGAAFPAGSTPALPDSDWPASFNWGFYVNIPLIYTFHLTPTAELYKFGAQNATDMAIAFKFIVPLSRFSLYVGAVPGLTAVGDLTAAHVGVLVGTSFNLVSNLYLFVQGKYKWVFQGDQNVRVLHANAGILFNF